MLARHGRECAPRRLTTALSRQATRLGRPSRDVVGFGGWIVGEERMAKPGYPATGLVLRDQVTGTSASARVSCGLALHHSGRRRETASSLIRGATVGKP